MRLTEQTRYALRVLTCCAEHDPDLVQVAAVAHETGLTDHTIYKLLKIATKEGIVRSARGRNGGIRLARRPAEITVGTVVRVFEPRFRACGPAVLIASHAAQTSADVRLEHALGAGVRAFLAAYDGMTLADLAGSPDPGDPAPSTPGALPVAT